MQEQTRTRGSEEQNVWSQENQIYYYSNFELFQKNSDAHQFYQYSIFTEELSKQLGQEWKLEANNLLYPHSNSKDVFLTLLTMWLKYHGPKLQTTLPAPIFQQAYVDQFLNALKVNTLSKDLKVNQTSARALCMGFFLTANDIWQDMFQKSIKQENSSNQLLLSVSKTLQITLKPIMVVKEKFRNIFGKKKIKKNQINQSQIQGAQIMFENCYHEFRKTLELEKQLQRKMNQFSLEESRSQVNSEKMVEKKIFKEEEAPVKNNLLANMYQYVTKFLNRNTHWQVASSFVTQILQMTQINSLQGTKIKILRPAEDFYHKLIIVWLSLKGQKPSIQFSGYLNRVKETFGSFWQQKYIIPTKYFFDKISQNWEQMQLEAQLKNLNDKQILNLLITRIKKKMAQDWDKKIQIQKKNENKEVFFIHNNEMKKNKPSQ